MTIEPRIELKPIKEEKGKEAEDVKGEPGIEESPPKMSLVSLSYLLNGRPLAPPKDTDDFDLENISPELLGNIDYSGFKWQEREFSISKLKEDVRKMRQSKESLEELPTEMNPVELKDAVKKVLEERD